MVCVWLCPEGALLSGSTFFAKTSICPIFWVTMVTATTYGEVVRGDRYSNLVVLINN